MAKKGRARNKIRGRYAQSIGETWESVIENEAGRLASLVLIKQHPQTGFFGRGQARVIGAAWADFIFMGANFACTFDAKTTKNKKRLTIPSKKFHQFAKLKLASAVGIPAFYLTWWRNRDQIAAHFITATTPWPYAMDLSTAEFTASKEPGWLAQLIEFIRTDNVD